MLNHVTVMGRLTADPELRHTNGDIAVASFRVAVDRDFKDKATGERGADFFPVVCWRATAEFAARYLNKGRQVVVSGRLQVRDYTDREGHKRSATEIIAENVYFADSRPEGAAPRTPAPEGFVDLGDEEDDGELPF